MYRLRELQKQIQAERKDLGLGERVTRTEAVITERDRQLATARANLRKGSKEQAKALIDVAWSPSSSAPGMGARGIVSGRRRGSGSTVLTLSRDMSGISHF